MKTEKNIKFTNDAPMWRIVFCGINLEGLCENRNCQAYQKKVWCNLTKRFGSFCLLDAVEQTNCPSCKSQINPNTVNSIGFFACKFLYKGLRLKNGFHPNQQDSMEQSEYDKIYQTGFISKGDSFIQYDSGNIAWWKFLTIETKELEDSSDFDTEKFRDNVKYRYLPEASYQEKFESRKSETEAVINQDLQNQGGGCIIS